MTLHLHADEAFKCLNMRSLVQNWCWQEGQSVVQAYLRSSDRKSWDNAAWLMRLAIDRNSRPQW